MKRILSLGAAALAAFVGGCGDGPSTVPGGYRNAATWSSFIYATRDGPLRLDLGGDPFGGNGPDLTQEVTKAMAGAIPGRPFTVTTLAAAAPLADLRVVMQLGAPANADARDLCAGRTREVRPPAAGGRIEVLAVFCDGSTLLSSSRGWVAKVDGPADRRFRQLIAQLTRDLLGDPP